jgi:hypothetical protein
VSKSEHEKLSANLALILSVLTFATGIVVAVNRFVWRHGIGAQEPVEDLAAQGSASQRRQGQTGQRHMSGFMMTIVEYSRSFFNSVRLNDADAIAR